MADSHTERMDPQERRAGAGLALVFAFRMLGMFMVLPVLATYGQDLAGATPLLIGLAIGAYGLTQAVLQIPFGMLSDRIGRLPVIYTGLLIFALGAAVAANADSIYGVIAGRVLQGAGAISAAVMAMLSDLTRDQFRTRAMAMIGMSIGLSFAAAMILGPILTHAFGLSGLFWVTTVMALLGIAVIAFVVPKPTRLVHHRESEVAPAAISQILHQPDLLRLDFAIAALHCILMASFVALPLALVHDGGLPKEQHWWVYLLSLVVGFFAMIPFIIIAEKKRKMKTVLLGAVATLLACELLWGLLGHSLTMLVIGNIVFFTAFNLLEASLPSLISKMAPAGGKGTAMGIYSTSQFIGAAVGGILGGWLFSLGGVSVVFLGCALLAGLWLVVAATMNEPPYVTSMRLCLSPEAVQDAGLVERLKATPGVADAVVVADEAALYIKADTQIIDRTALEGLIRPAAL